ncbi:MAG: hypothetical protein HON68_01825 [Gammaproteobacteria bacterium]|jgi:hypothetical protein|nr:hypothetical protein [Gammaproteobacteria bacterium]MBT3489031.1 hypothetical protein [Gammaproteobacteria bacterium]MBT3719783.1 hypothetical protein [Gammaproteobacteria bacterium]MBT3844081.1 hypothetical protein [Gammaproteobacteria bacterium]MBT3893563.1 hypothetical protein [Gammaproteobacteria bacterium]
MKVIKRITGVCLTVSLSALTTTSLVYASGHGEHSGQQLDELIHAAHEAVQVANRLGFEWRDSGKILKQAEKAASEGNVKKAKALANKAKLQGEAGQVQAHAQAKAGPRFDEIVSHIRATELELARAQLERKEAAKVGFEWRDTGKILKKAKTAAAGHHYDKAIKLASKAKMQGIAAQAQAADQMHAAPRF